MANTSEELHFIIDGDWYDDLVREHINENDFEKALDLVRAITDSIPDITDAEREQIEMEIMNGSRHFFSAEDGMIGISEIE